MSTVEALRRQGYEAVHLREQKLERLPDSDILEKARRERRTVITFDLDFGDLLAAGGHLLPSVIIFRLRDQTPPSVTPKLLEIISHQRSELETGVLIVVEEMRYRVRKLPIEPVGGTPE